MDNAPPKEPSEITPDNTALPAPAVRSVCTSPELAVPETPPVTQSALPESLIQLWPPATDTFRGGFIPTPNPTKPEVAVI